MDLERLHKILNETTVQLRKGPVLDGTPELVAQAEAGEDLTQGGILEVYAMPHINEVPHSLVQVDMEFLAIGVDKPKAEARRDELVAILRSYPDPERLAGGPSYIEIGAAIGDQGAAFQLFALGKVLGLWDVITPSTLGFTGEEARAMAGQGFIMISGWRSDNASAA